MIQIKDKNVLTSILGKDYDPILTILIEYVIDIGNGIFITEAYRPQRHPSDLHGIDPVRAIDGGTKEVKDPQALADRINAKWLYDPTRPVMKCALYHAQCPMCGWDHIEEFRNTCQSCKFPITDFWHIHFQVHPNTVFK